MSVLKRVASGTSAAVLTLSSLMTMGFTGIASAVSGSDTCTWTGQTDSNFNIAGNWSGCSGAAPVDGDSLIFDVTSLTADKTLNNNISNLSLGTITFQGTNSEYHDYEISGLGVSLHGIVDNSSTGNTINMDVTLSADTTMTGSVAFGSSTAHKTLNLNGHDLTINANGGAHFDKVSGTGNIIVSNGGIIDFAYDQASTFTGGLILNGSSYAVIFPGNLPAANSVTIHDGSGFGFCGFNGADFANPITIAGRGSSETNAGTTTYEGALVTLDGCGHGAGVGGFSSNANVNLTGTLTLTANTTVGGSGELKVSGPLHGNFSLTQEAGNAGRVNITSSDNQSSTTNGVQNSAVQTVTYGDNSPSTPIYASTNQIGIVDGTYGDTGASDGGVIKGSGTVSSLTAYNGGILAPGHSPGKMTVLNTLELDGGAVYQAELKTKADGEYDQLVVGKATDTDNNNPAVTLGDITNGLPTLTGSLYDGFKIAAGDTFTIINNLSKTTVKGTFKDLPEGATFKIATGTFKISYVGGDGNDVVLTALTAPKTPDTGFALMSAHPGMTLGLTALASGAIFTIARSNRKLAPAKARLNGKRR